MIVGGNKALNLYDGLDLKLDASGTVDSDDPDSGTDELDLRGSERRSHRRRVSFYEHRRHHE